MARTHLFLIGWCLSLRSARSRSRSGLLLSSNRSKNSGLLLNLSRSRDSRLDNRRSREFESNRDFLGFLALALAGLWCLLGLLGGDGLKVLSWRSIFEEGRKLTGSFFTATLVDFVAAAGRRRAGAGADGMGAGAGPAATTAERERVTAGMVRLKKSW